MIEHWPIDPTPEGHENWLIRRKRDLTSSTIGALFGVHPWQTIAGLHAEKMGMELPGPDPDSAVIRRGTALEMVVAAEVAKLRPEWLITKATEYLRDPHARIGATPDFRIEGDPRGVGMLQTKTMGSWKFKKECLSEDGDEPTPPTWMILQNATEVMLADAAFGAIGILVIGDVTFDCHVIEVPRHRATEHKIRVAVNLFWQAVDSGQVPQLDYERDGDLVSLLYPREVEGSIIDLTRDNRAAWLCEERARQAEIIKEAEAAKVAAETELKEKLADHEAALINGWRCTLKTTHRKERMQKAIDFRVLRTSRIMEDV
jgi:predicted phage-related endonuclease